MPPPPPHTHTHTHTQKKETGTAAHIRTTFLSWYHSFHSISCQIRPLSNLALPENVFYLCIQSSSQTSQMNLRISVLCCYFICDCDMWVKFKKNLFCRLDVFWNDTLRIYLKDKWCSYFPNKVCWKVKGRICFLKKISRDSQSPLISHCAEVCDRSTLAGCQWWGWRHFLF